MTKNELIRKEIIKAFDSIAQIILLHDENLESLDFTTFRANFDIKDPENSSNIEKYSVCLSIEQVPIIKPKPYTKDY